MMARQEHKCYLQKVKCAPSLDLKLNLTVAAVKRFMNQAIDLGFWMGLCADGVGITLSDEGLLSGDKWNS